MKKHYLFADENVGAFAEQKQGTFAVQKHLIFYLQKTSAHLQVPVCILVNLNHSWLVISLS